MEHHQVIIVGAGPAGAACARALQQENIAALIFEKEDLPRNKICSGILFGQTQELLQKYFGSLPPESIYCRQKTIEAAHILEWSRETGFIPYVWELAKDGHEFPATYFNTWRSVFDHWLVQQAGAPVRGKCQVRSYTAEGEKLQVTVFQKGQKLLEPPGGDPRLVVSCDYLVGADGSSSTVRRLLHPSWFKPDAAVVIYQEYCPVQDLGALKDGYWYVFFEKHIGEMLSCAHCKDDFLTLCVGGFRGRDLRAAMKIFKTFLTDNFQVSLATEDRVEGCVLHPGPPDLGSGRVLLTGEAAGFMYLNGEGISAAIDSGYRCGSAIARAIKTRGDALAIYAEATADIRRHMQLCLEKVHFLTV